MASFYLKFELSFLPGLEIENNFKRRLRDSLAVFPLIKIKSTIFHQAWRMRLNNCQVIHQIQLQQPREIDFSIKSLYQLFPAT